MNSPTCVLNQVVVCLLLYFKGVLPTPRTKNLFTYIPNDSDKKVDLLFNVYALIVIGIGFPFQVSKAQKSRKDLNPSSTRDAKGIFLIF
jgi:hypothetical protein